MEAPRPVAAPERVVLLDVLRGFALYGVLLANMMEWYSGLEFLPWAESMARMSTPINAVAGNVIGVLIASKSLTLLTFLFGLGFAVQLDRAEARGQSVVPLYFRRLAALFVIGICHVLLLWWGDILNGYAIAGLALVLFRKARPRTLLAWAFALIFVPRLVVSVPWIAEKIHEALPHTTDQEAFSAQVLAAIKGHDHVLLAKMQATHALYFVSAIAAWYFPWVLGRFLLGYWAGRTRLLHDAPAHLPYFRKLLIWGLTIGLLCSGITVARRILFTRGVPPSPVVRLLWIIPLEVSFLAMAAAYLGAIVLLMQRPAWRRRLMFFKPLGQMALTTYLSQSLISTFIFYGWGLGLAGTAGPAICIPISLGIFAAQGVFSRLWLRRFRFGPAEWVWRSLTYLRPQPMRRGREDALQEAAHGARGGR